MARPKSTVGELGAVQVTRLASGLFRARGRVRDDGGTVNQLRGVGQTEDEARTELCHKALTLDTGGLSDLSASNTIAEAGAAWLRHVKTRAATGSLAYPTYDSYESTRRLIIVPRCGAITLGSLTVGRCDRIIQGLLMDGSLSKARRARSVLSLICGYAVRDDATSLNPVRDVQHLPTPEKKTSVLEPEQITVVRELTNTWRETGARGPRPDYRALIDGMDSNYERLLRSFVNDNRDALVKLDIDVDEYTTHLYRRTTATLVERVAGITLASRLLGHASEQTTRASYVVSAERVDPVTADILDEVLGGVRVIARALSNEAVVCYY